jgi:hypothetical protein
MTIFFLAYHFGSKEKAVLFMKNCMTFTAPFETGLGYMFQLVLVTEQCSLGVYVCVCAAGVDSHIISVLFLPFNGTFHSVTEML